VVVAARHAFLFVLSFWGVFRVQNLLLVIGVLFLHESGHYLGMRLFSYRNVQMFFIPFFGAAVSGSRHAATVWQQAMVLLLGPLPDIALVQLLAALLRPTFTCSAGELVSWLVGINAFNLLPFVPLDSGRFFDLLLFARQTWLTVGFHFFAVCGLAALAWWFVSWCFGFVAILMFLGLPFRYYKAKRERAFRDNPLELPERLDNLDEAHWRELFGWARLLNPLNTTPRGIAIEMRGIHEAMLSRHPGFWGRVGLLLLYLTSIAAAAGAVVLLVQSTDTHDARLADELATAYAPTADLVHNVRQQAAQLDKDIENEPGKADALRPQVVRLRVEADEKWSDLMAEWKAHPPRVQARAFAQALRAEFSGGHPRMAELLRLRAELSLPDKGP
jgi:hypothetical protein